jgi:hypothetical protein
MGFLILFLLLYFPYIVNVLLYIKGKDLLPMVWVSVHVSSSCVMGWWWPQFSIESRFDISKTFYELDVTVNIDIVFHNTHITQTHKPYRHQRNDKAAASSCDRRMPRYFSLRAIWSLFQVRKIVDMDINFSLGVIGYNLYLKHLHWCVNQKYILIYSITHHACFVIVFHLVTTLCPISATISHNSYKYTKNTQKLYLKPAIPPDVLPVK